MYMYMYMYIYIIHMYIIYIVLYVYIQIYITIHMCMLYTLVSSYFQRSIQVSGSVVQRPKPRLYFCQERSEPCLKFVHQSCCHDMGILINITVTIYTYITVCKLLYAYVIVCILLYVYITVCVYLYAYVIFICCFALYLMLDVTCFNFQG